MASPKKQKKSAKPKEKQVSNKLDLNEVDPQPWQNFEQCWNTCVNNGTPVLMAACKAHIASLGWLADQSKWIDGIVNFGIKIED